MARSSTIVARSYQEAQSRQDGADLVGDSMRCGQIPLNRWFWSERAFCDMAWHGPARASGLVIWNHGIHGTVMQYTAPVPPVFRLLQARGWDVAKIARNNLGETSGEQSLYRAVQRTLDEVAARRAPPEHREPSPPHRRCPSRTRRRAAKELLPKLPDSVTVLHAPDALAGSWYGILEPSGEVVSFAIVDAGGIGRRAMFGSVSGWRRGGLHDFTTGEGGLTFRLGERGTITVKDATPTWRLARGTGSQAAKLLPGP